MQGAEQHLRVLPAWWWRRGGQLTGWGARGRARWRARTGEEEGGSTVTEVATQPLTDGTTVTQSTFMQIDTVNCEREDEEEQKYSAAQNNVPVNDE